MALVAVAALLCLAAPGSALGAGPAPGSGGDTAQGSIVKGSTASLAEFPWIAYVRYRGAVERFSCTGTVVAPRLVLTAGHCALSGAGRLLTASRYRVATGASDLKRLTPANVSRVTQVLVPPGFHPSGLIDDAALLVLAAPVAAPPLQLASEADAALAAPGAALTIAGWGLTSGNSSRTPTVLRKGATVVERPGYCSRRLRRVGRFRSAFQICADSPPRFEVGSCNGDSGGPGIATRPDGTQVQVGIISWGAPFCDARIPEVLSRVARVSAWVGSWVAAIEAGAPAPAIVVPKVRLERLSIGAAEERSIYALAGDFGGRFLRGRGHRIACNRINRVRVKCGITWYRGANDYWGSITIFNAIPKEGPSWDYRYTIRWVNHRCWVRKGNLNRCHVWTRRR